MQNSKVNRNIFFITCHPRRRRRAIRELKQPRRRRQQKPHKFAYLTMKNNSFARFARAFFIFWHFEDVLVLSTTWNDLFRSCVDDVSIWWQMFNFVCLCLKLWFQFNSRIIRTHFSSIMTLNKWKLVAETRRYIFRWRSRFRRRRVCLSSLVYPLSSQRTVPISASGKKLKVKPVQLPLHSVSKPAVCSTVLLFAISTDSQKENNEASGTWGGGESAFIY